MSERRAFKRASLAATAIALIGLGASGASASSSSLTVVERATTAMIDEGLRILDEGIAARPSDIDLVMLHGYAFPRWRGGLMHYADGVGLATLRDRITGYAAQDPLSWSVPPLLDRLLAKGRRLSDLD